MKKLTFKQRIAYAHWSAKLAFNFPWVGCIFAFVVGCIITFCFIFPKIKCMMDIFPSDALGKRILLGIFVVIAIIAASYITIYIPYFLVSFFDNDEISRGNFLKNYYHKKNPPLL